jgi:hypothetical protein
VDRTHGFQPRTAAPERSLSEFRWAVSVTVSEILTRRADLTRQLAALDDALAIALRDAEKPEEPDRVLSLAEAAAHVGEPVSTFRQRLVYRQALVSAATERRLRFSRRALDRIAHSRLAS